MTFEHWLSKHIEYDNEIGDLARDYKNACILNRVRNEKKEKLTLEHLHKWGASQEAIDAFHKAKSLYADFIISTKR